MVRQTLLNTRCIETNKYFEKYLLIVTTPDTEGYVEKHHILPASYFRITNQPVDNSSTNLVTLSPYNHILAHYYLYRCVTNGEWKNRLALTFVFMKKGKQGHLLSLSEAEFLKTLPEYAELCEYKYWRGKKRSRVSVEKSIKTRLENKDVIYAKISASNTGKKRTAEAKRLMSDRAKQREPRKGFNLTEAHKQLLREANLGKKQSEETKEKRRNSLNKLIWFTDGTVDIRSTECPEGFHEGRSYKMTDETKAQCSQRGKRWFNNGVTNTMAFECPDGFVPGRLK